MRHIFVGLTDYGKPYTRVRCYHFADSLRRAGLDAGVFSFQEHLTDITDGTRMLDLPQRERLRLTLRALRRLPKAGAMLYLQKVHYHAAAPFLLHRLCGLPYILDYDDWDLDRSPLFSAAVNRLIFGATDATGVTAAVARHARCCVAASHALVELLRQWHPEVHYLPTGVDTSRFVFQPCTLPATPTFAWTGMIWGKVMHDNVVFLIDALREVRNTHPLTLRLAGDGEWFPAVIEHVRRHGDESWVHFAGALPPRDMPGFLKNCHVGLVPLLPDPANAQWMAAKSPTKIFEFMAAGLPVLASDFGEIRRVIRDGDNGLLFRDRASFVRQCRALLTEPSLYPRLAETAHDDCVARYALPVLARQLAEIITRHTNA